MTIDDRDSDTGPDRTSTRTRGPVDLDPRTGPTGTGGHRTRASDGRTAGEGRTSDRPVRWAAGHVIIAVTVALTLGGLLNAEGLLATAKRQEFGFVRELSVGAAERLVAVSRTLNLEQPRRAIDQALGRTDGEPRADEPDLEEGDPNSPPADGPAADEGEPQEGGDTATEDGQPADGDDPPQDTGSGDEPQPDDGANAGEGTGPDRGSGPDDEPDDGPRPGDDRDPITADDPLTMYIGGDSMVGQFGTALEDLVDDTGVVETTEILYEFGSGLTRPDFIDWNVIMAEVSREQDPDVIVLYFGGNDAQPLKLDGVVYEPEDEPWQREYRSRVNALMAQLQEAGHTIYWMGMPIPRSETLEQRYVMLNGIYESEADAHPAVTFVPAWDHFATPDGEFSEYLPNASGDVVDMRLDDGIHYTTAGAYRIARVVADRIIADHGITPVS